MELNAFGWRLDYDYGRGGIVLQNVTHEGFSLAKDVRITRVWLATDPPSSATARTAATDFVLGSPELPLHDTVPLLSHNPVANYAMYTSASSLYARFDAKDEWLAGEPNVARLLVMQRHLFGWYGKNPPHEPGGVLDAARFMPILTFVLPPVKDRRVRYPRYIRIDYRIDVALDNISSGSVTTKTGLGTDRATNKAAIFRDSEHLPGLRDKAAIGITWGGAPQVGVPAVETENVKRLYAAIEKPLHYEIASYGLLGGEAPGGWTRDKTWDNVHVWAARRGVGDRNQADDPITSPGAFHALHLHWRWGAVSGDLSERGDPLKAAGDLPFRGVGWTTNMGGPLVDPRLPNQNLTFAITCGERPEWGATAFPRNRVFADTFENVRTPMDVSKGSDLVLWLSFEAFRRDEDLDRPWHGSVFPQGMYFAHGPEQAPLMAVLGGARGEAENPPAKPIWRRPAR